MLKEICEQTDTIFDCIRGRVVANGTAIKLSGVNDHPDRFINTGRILISGMRHFLACRTNPEHALSRTSPAYRPEWVCL